MEKQQLKDLVVNALENMKAKDIVIIDVAERTSVTDYMVIASGSSTRHVRSVAEQVVKDCKDAGVRPFGSEGADASDWVLVDLGDVVVHVMMPSAREFYDLEKFWRDGPVADESGPADSEASGLKTLGSS